MRRYPKIKRDRLEHKWGRPFRAIYHELRVVRGLDMVAVARECGVTRQTVWEWLRDTQRTGEAA